MPVWDLLLAGRLYPCLKGMLVFCGIPMVFMEAAFVQYASLRPITLPLFKGNVIALWYTSGIHGNGISLVCQSGTHYYLDGCTLV